MKQNSGEIWSFLEYGDTAFIQQSG